MLTKYVMIEHCVRKKMLKMVVLHDAVHRIILPFWRSGPVLQYGAHITYWNKTKCSSQ
jgi:hypothetical protein